MENAWKMIGCPERRGEGQRFFVRGNNSDSLYICDNSGEDPDRTDDGPLRFLMGSKIHIGLYIKVPVYIERHDEESRCGVTYKELLWMLENSWAKPTQICVAEHLLPMQKVFAHIGLPVGG